MVVGLAAAVLAGGVWRPVPAFADVGVLAAVLGAVAAALLSWFRGTLRLLAPRCSPVGAAAPCTVAEVGSS